MNILYLLYIFWGILFFPVLFPLYLLYSLITGKYSKGIKERLGFIPESKRNRVQGSPHIWLHAASLGEVKTAIPIVESLRKKNPDCSITISTTTEHGNSLARELFHDSKASPVHIVFAPVDLFFSIRLSLSAIKPDVIVFMETEIWPAWIIEAGKKGIKTVLINGRISARSIPRYRRFRSFFNWVLKDVAWCSMIGTEDAERLASLGVPKDKIIINGNAKYDFLADKADPLLEKKVRNIFNVDKKNDVFVAGSTRSGEEEILLDTLALIKEEYPEIIAFIAPRHLERVADIEELLKKRGIRYQLRTDIGQNNMTRKAPVVLINTFGELFGLYSLGTINFCGGSLIPQGGQNPLEAAVWGKVVFHGPSMDDFLDAKAILEKANGGVEVSNPKELAQKALWYLNNRDALKEHGEKAKVAVLDNQGAARRHAEVIEKAMKETGPGRRA